MFTSRVFTICISISSNPAHFFVVRFSNEIVNYCDDSITIVNASEDFFPSLNSILVGNQDGNVCCGTENIQHSDLFTNNSGTKENPFRKARKKDDNSMVCNYCGKQFRRKHLLSTAKKVLF